MDNNQANFPKLTIIIVAGIIILSLSVLAAFRYSQKQSGNIILPGGVTYLGPSPTVNPSPTIAQPPTAPIRFTAETNTTWNTYLGKIYPYSFSYPSSLPLVVFPNDSMDSVAIAWGNIPPQQNILLNVEQVDKRDPSYGLKPKIEYVENWYKFFSGLKGVAKIEKFTNSSGLKGYKAYYLNYANTSPNIDIFFEIPQEPKLMIHVANGILDPSIFERLINSLKWIPATPIKK